MIEYYKAKLSQVRKAVGAKCTYLAFSQEGGKHFFLANILNDSGAKDKVKIEINNTPEQLEDKDYQELTEILKTRSYVGS
jgi:hypothetical protein